MLAWVFGGSCGVYDFWAVNYGASVFRECRFFIVEIGLGRAWNEISGRLSGKD